jgi:TP901 family phage tail tape measure protein
VSVVANVAINVDSRNAVGKLRQVNDAGSKLEQTFKGVDGKLRDSSGKFVKLGDSAQASTNKINVLARALSNLGTGLAVADVARRYFKGFNEAEKAAAAVRTLGVDSKALEGNLLGLSQKLGGLYSQTQLLTAAYDVASSGFANAADNTKVLEAAAKGATGGLSDIGTVGNAVTSVLNAYGKSADEAASLVDGFIQTQNDGKIILNEYAGYIGKLAPTAKAAGVGINEMNAAIATITAQGVPVEATFTGLNQALVSILKPSQEAEELAKSLGIQFNEAGLRAKGFGGLLEEVKTKTGGSTTQLVKLFGSVDALKAILPLVNDDLVKYNQNVVKQANASGVAEKATQELGGTVSSEITKMINQIGNLTRALDTVLGPSLGGIVRLINFVIAEATKGIQVLGQLFSMSPNKMIAQQAVRSGQIGAAPRTLAGIDETIGEKRRKALQQQAGAGTGFLGLGMNTEKFIKLLQQQPEFKSPVASKPTLPTLPNALNTPLGATVGSGGGRAAGGGADKAANDAARAAEQAAQVEKQIQDRLRGLIREVELIDQIAGIKELQFQAEMDGNKELQIRLQGEERIIQIMQSTAQALDDITDERLKQNILAKAESEIASSRQETLFEMQRIDNERTKSFNEIIAGLDLELALKTATTEQAREQLRLEAEIAKLRGQGFTPEQIGTITAKKTELAAPKTDQQNITEKIATLKKEIADLTSISNIAITSAEGIGNAFAQSFQGLISGTMTAKEALGSFFKSVADMFLEMAAQIIAKQITMIILQTILKALGGGAFTGGTSSAVPTDAAGWGSSFNTQLPGLSGDIGRTPIGFARGGAFSNSIVSSPTMFKFANGGAMRTGLMGEAGPEAIMPLSRGADGSLGVQANGLREAMDRQQGGGSGSPVLNMSFQSTSINGVEYVSRDQLESAMAETRRNATRDGAKRGMTMTLDRIQNSSSTRRKVGI